MKRFICSLFILLLILSSSAIAADHAFDKGAFRIGGNLYLQQVSGSAYRNQTILNFSSSTSFAISKGIFVGIIGNVQNYKNDNYPSSTNWTAGPLVELYFPEEDVEKTVAPYARFFFAKGKIADLDMQKIGFNLGIIKMISENIGLDFSVMYSFDKMQVRKYVFNPYFDFSYNLEVITETGKSLQVGIGIESYIF